jgi:hypothetical protein
MPPDDSEVEVGMALGVTDGLDHRPQLRECVVVVSGPDEDGDICILAAREAYLPRETARGLAHEILRRLGEMR